MAGHDAILRTSIHEKGIAMSLGSKVLVGTIAGFLAVAYSWIFRAKKVHSERDTRADGS